MKVEASAKSEGQLKIRPVAVLAGVWVIAVALILGRGGLAEGLEGMGQAFDRLGTGWTPAGPWLAANAARSMAAIVWCVVMLAASDAIGGAMLGLIARPSPNSCLRWTTPLAGYAVISLAVLGLASTGLCFPRVIGVAMAFGVVVAIRGIVGGMVRMPGRVRELVRETPVAVISLVAVCVLNLPRLVLPEHNEDCLMYHLALPQQLLLRHRLPGPPSYCIWAYPLLADFPGVFAIRLGLDASVRLVGLAIMGLGAAACVSVFAKGMRGGWAALIALVALFVPSGSWFFLTAKNDTASCGYMLAAVAILSGAGGRRGEAGHLIWGAWMSGCAVAAKYTLGPMAAVGLCAFVPWRRLWSLRFAAGALTVAATPLVPWLLVSGMNYADPLHPYGAIMMPGVFGIDDVGRLLRDQEGDRAGFARRILDNATQVGELCIHNSWLALAAIPSWWLLRDTVMARAAVTAVLGAWLLMVLNPGGQTHMARFVFPALVLLDLMGLAGCACAVRCIRTSESVRRWLSAGAALALGAVALVLACRIHPYVTWKEDEIDLRGRDYLSGRMDAEDYRRSLMGSFGVIQPRLAAAIAGGRGRILVTGGKFLWGIPAPLVTVGIGVPPVWTAVNPSTNPDRLAVSFRQAGVRWILYDSDVGAWDRIKVGPFAWTPRMLRLYADYAKSRFVVVASTQCEGPGHGQHWLFELAGRPHPAAERVPVLPGADAAFAEATVAGLSGNRARAIDGFRAVYDLLPDVTAARCALGHALVQTGGYREGYAHVRAAAEDGLANCTEPAPLNWALAAFKTRRMDEAISVYRHALAIYRRWPSVPIEALQRLL